MTYSPSQQPQTDLAAFGEVLDVTVAPMLSPRDGSCSLLGCLVKLGSALLQSPQKGPYWLGQVGCIKSHHSGHSASRCMLSWTLL